MFVFIAEKNKSLFTWYILHCSRYIHGIYYTAPDIYMVYTILLQIYIL